MGFDISSEELRELITTDPNVLVVDVRSAKEFAEGHIETAVNWPLEVLSDKLDNHTRDGSIIFVCQTGRRSLQAYNLAKMIGWKNIRNLAGGFAAW